MPYFPPSSHIPPEVARLHLQFLTAIGVDPEDAQELNQRLLALPRRPVNVQQGQHPQPLLPALPPRLQSEPNGTASASLEGMPLEMIFRIGQYLSPQELLPLIRTSLTTRWQARQDVRYAEFKKYQVALRAWDDSVRNQAGNGGACEAFYTACAEIAHARAARGEVHALYPAMREAQRLAELPGLSAVPYASERLLVEAAAVGATFPDSMWLIHDRNWRMRDAQRASQAPTLPNDPVDDFRNSMRVLRNALARNVTADLRRPGEWVPGPSELQRPVHYIEHFADEPFEPGDMIEQTHRFDDGQLQTQRQPRPDPQAGESMVRFKFGPDGVFGHVYVHVFNLPKAELDMNAPE
ncbi:hypothetical protein [Caenimonas koreensis]|uniref:hypothetical protein n=1 Tax=Caenimonas koreensis TaxID=367474 RepID=UPI0037839FD9